MNMTNILFSWILPSVDIFEYPILKNTTRLQAEEIMASTEYQKEIGTLNIIIKSLNFLNASSCMSLTLITISFQKL